MKTLILAIPKGRILQELSSVLDCANIIPESEFYDPNSRKLIFSTNLSFLKLILVRSFDVANLVKYGAADIGICGSDVFEEFLCDEIHSMLDLKVGKCRLSIAMPASKLQSFDSVGHVRVATKYPNIAKRHFGFRGIQAEVIKLNGAIEIAPALGLSSIILDLVSSGKTLAENNLTEVKKIFDVSSLLIANRASLKLNRQLISEIISSL